MELKLILINNLLLFLFIFLFGCEHLEKIQVKGEVTGTKYSSQQFTKGKHNIKGKVAQPYISEHSMDVGMPDYGETGLEILF
jgi:hypothetical protein